MRTNLLCGAAAMLLPLVSCSDNGRARTPPMVCLNLPLLPASQLCRAELTLPRAPAPRFFILGTTPLHRGGGIGTSLVATLIKP
jgi:hypothetical protein